MPGASWKHLGGRSYKRCRHGKADGDTLDVPPGEWVPVEFGEVPNWIKPSLMLVTAAPEAEVEYTAIYVPRNYQAIQDALAALGASPVQRAPSADFDGDGVSNLLEWAFNLDPAARDAATLTPVTGIRGLPVVTLVGSGSSRRLRVELVRLSTTVNPILRYGVEFSSGMTPADWSESGRIVAVGRIDDYWERVVVEDSQEGRPARFARVKVTHN